MYQGKFSENRSARGGRFSQHRSHGRKRSLLLLVSVFVLTFAMVGGTLAYLATNTTPVVNTFEFGKSDITIPEEIKGGVKKKVSVQNNGNIDAYVRAQIIVTWKNAAGEIIPADSSAFTCTMNGDWFQKNGTWYCKNMVAPGGSAVLFTNGKKAGTPPADGYDLSVEILAQSCQADGKTADGEALVTTIWPVTVVNGQLQ